MSVFTWEEIPVPNVNGMVTFGEAFSISPDGKNIVGTYGIPGTPAFTVEFHGFLRDASGQKYSYDFPFNKANATSARGVDDFQNVVGFYRDEERNRELHGYFWPRSAPPRDFDMPDANFPTTDEDGNQGHNGVLGINNQGYVVGLFNHKTEKNDFGYVWGPQNTPINPQIIDIRRFTDRVKDTWAQGINSHGDIVGSFTKTGVNASAPIETHGFKWKVDIHPNAGLRMVGEPTILDVSPQGATAIATMANGINDHGWIVGEYDTNEPRPDNRATRHGFVWKPEAGGKYVSGDHIKIDLNGATDTVVNGISSHGRFVGFYRAPVSADNKTIIRHAFKGDFLAKVNGGPIIRQVTDAIFQLVSSDVALGARGWVFPLFGPPRPEPSPDPVMRLFGGKDVMVAVALLQLVADVTDNQIRDRMQLLALDLLQSQLRR